MDQLRCWFQWDVRSAVNNKVKDVGTQGTPWVQFANKEDGLVSRAGLPHCLRLCIDPCMAWHAQSLNSRLHAWPQNLEAFSTTRKWAKKDKMWSVLLSNIRFLWFLQSIFLLSYLYQWCGFCWQSLCRNLWPQFVYICSFARLKNKHIGVLGTNVATISWLHWSPVSGYMMSVLFNKQLKN